MAQRGDNRYNPHQSELSRNLCYFRREIVEYLEDREYY